MVDLAEILRQHWPGYERKFGSRLLPSHRRAVRAILACRTAALGGHVYRCGDCGHLHYAYHSCNHRACCRCGHGDASQWIARQKTKLLPVPYFLVTFTVPAALRPWIRSHQKLGYGWLFAHSAAALQEVAQREKYLGAQLGLVGVLHTWTRDLRYHPHVHYLVPGGGLSADGRQWRRTSPEFLLPERVLAARFRTRWREQLQREHPEVFQQIPARVWQERWVVDIISVGSGEAALKYLSAYIYRTALSAQRLMRCDAQTVTFNYRPSGERQWKACALPAEKFLHRFLQHVLPAGFQRVRYFGWLAPQARKRWQRILRLLRWRAAELIPAEPSTQPECPRCRKPMRWVAELPRAPPLAR